MAIYENLTIEKGMYAQDGSGLTKQLEKLDPSENYRGTSLDGLDAFERQLKRFDIKVSGPGSDCVEKFFQTSNSAALFPEYVSRAVHSGMEYRNVLDDIIAVKTHINGFDYRSIKTLFSNDDLEMRYVNEGTIIPETTISLSDKLVKLRKRGRMLSASYEAIRFQRIDVFTAALRRIGAHIATILLNDIYTIVIDGDGNNNPAEVLDPITSGAIGYGDLINMWGKLSPYELNVIMTSTSGMKNILSMSEMKDSFAGHTFHRTGEMITPLGAKLIHTPTLMDGAYIGLDKNYALEMVIAQDVMTEYDKLIDKQLERVAISMIAGFSKLTKEASVVLAVE